MRKLTFSSQARTGEKARGRQCLRQSDPTGLGVGLECGVQDQRRLGEVPSLRRAEEKTRVCPRVTLGLDQDLLAQLYEDLFKDLTGLGSQALERRTTTSLKGFCAGLETQLPKSCQVQMLLAVKSHHSSREFRAARGYDLLLFLGCCCCLSNSGPCHHRPEH